MGKHLRTDHSILDDWPESNPRYPTVWVEDQEVQNVLYGPKGEVLKYLVDIRKEEIGYRTGRSYSSHQ